MAFLYILCSCVQPTRGCSSNSSPSDTTAQTTAPATAVLQIPQHKQQLHQQQSYRYHSTNCSNTNSSPTDTTAQATATPTAVLQIPQHKQQLQQQQSYRYHSTNNSYTAAHSTTIGTRTITELTTYVYTTVKSCSKDIKSLISNLT